ncbi:hypothetical protein MKW94_026679 [Papaver nudicaule]|uniref:Uncharacterized protein n=1 Tax=Papaver nudicaule TaxID=74823 RepID=A0AA41VPH2_PAPNU|nr:hypothetical protein [Papaver nudicaule]
MGSEITQDKEMDLVLSTEAKPRLKWTAELHRRFVDAVTQLGGCEKATPKSLMRSMSIPGLTLYHLKSHLQKYRLIGKKESCSHNGPEEVDYRELEVRSDHVNGDGTGRPSTEMEGSLHIAQALQVQMEVQKKLHDQIEVQKHLQLRIEAQGKYLQSILTKAQDKLYNNNYGTSNAPRTTQATESIDTRNHSSSTSELTEIQGFSLMSSVHRRGGTDCSVDSSVTSSESSGKEIEKVQTDSSTEEEEEEVHNECSKHIPLLSLMETESCSSSGVIGKKRSGSGITASAEQPIAKKPNNIPLEMKTAGELRKHIGVKQLDLNLNCEYQNEVDSEF